MGLSTWWWALRAVSLVNLGLLGRLWAVHLKNKPGQRVIIRSVQCQLLSLSTFFVLGCAFRSFLPRADVRRIALVDSWLSSIFVGRTVATVAELCFVAQWALVLEPFARPAKLNRVVKFSRPLIPAILAAEVFSWRGVLTTNNFWHVVEESIWGACEVGLTLSALALRGRYQGRGRRFLDQMALCGAIYVTYMLAFDIPTYYSRWKHDEATSKRYTGFGDGLRNLAFQWTTTHRPQDWEGDVLKAVSGC